MYNGYLAILHYNKPVSDIRWANIFYSAIPPTAYSHIIIHTLKIENRFYLHNDMIGHLSTLRPSQRVQNVGNHYTKMYFLLPRASIQTCPPFALN